MASNPRPSFEGFSPEAFAFLRDLAEEQNRDWFQAHKKAYEANVFGPMTALVGDLAGELARRGIPLRGEPKGSVFRINRDVRFSKDKRPYKTNVSAALTRDGWKMSPGVVYVHVDPQGSFAASGFFQPENPVLAAIRDAIASDPAAFASVVQALKTRDLALAPDADSLKRMPRGYETVTDPSTQELLRRRSFIVRLPTLAEVGGRSLVRELADFAEASLPLLRFGWSAMET